MRVFAQKIACGFVDLGKSKLIDYSYDSFQISQGDSEALMIKEYQVETKTRGFLRQI